MTTPTRIGGGSKRAAALIAAVFALTCVPSLLAPAPSPAAGPPPDNFFGVDSVHAPPASEFALMRQAGVEVYRAPVFWRDVEPDPPVQVLDQTFRTYDWEEPDHYFRLAAVQGIRIQAALNTTAAWVHNNIAVTPWRSAAGRAGWVDFVRAAAARYGPDGEFWRENPELPELPPVAYQIWNEQNATGRYKPRPDPVEYAEMYLASVQAMRREDRETPILPGGMFGTPQEPGSLDAWAFIRAFLAEPGIRRRVDGVAIHPYSPNLRGVRFQFRKMRATLNSEGLPEMPLQLTEFGWSSGISKAFFFFQGRKGQARLLNQSFRLILKKREKWKVERVIWFSWRDIPREEAPPSCGFCAKFGLLKENLEPKPSYRKYTKYSLG